MVKSLGSAITEAKNAPEGTDVFIHIMTVTLTDPIAGDTVIRMARATETVTISSVEYLPFPFIVGETTEDLTGQLREVTVGMIDLTGEVAAFLKNNDVDGAKVDLGLAFYNGTTYVLAVSDSFTVIGYSTAAERITLQLGGRNYLEMPFPSRPLDRYRCGYVYGGVLCKYASNDDGSVRPSCDFSLNGANGCKNHDNSLNFGGFPSVPIKRVSS